MTAMMTSMSYYFTTSLSFATLLEYTILSGLRSFKKKRTILTGFAGIALVKRFHAKEYLELGYVVIEDAHFCFFASRLLACTSFFSRASTILYLPFTPLGRPEMPLFPPLATTSFTCCLGFFLAALLIILAMF